MLTELHLQNVKSHRDTHIKCKPITALIGPNGSGKSTVLEVLEIFGDSQFVNAHEYVKNKFFSIKSQKEKNVVVSVEIDDLIYRVSNQDQQWESCLIKKNDEKSQIKRDHIYVNDELSTSFRKFFYCKPIIPVLIQPYYYNGPIPVLGKYGSYLPNMINYLMTQKKVKFKKLIALINILIPSIKDINIEKKEVHVYNGNGQKGYTGALNAHMSKGTVWGESLTFDVDDNFNIPIESMSEGTLSLLFILTMIVNSDQNPILLIDDIEQGLHPKLQRELIQNIKKYQQEHPGFQIIFTTHSPYILDCLEPDEIHVLAKDKHGVTHCKSLENHPDSKRFMSILTTGEFVASVGEDWVIEEGGAHA